jgi:O-antigen/teichoic acid export membrane protein
LSKGPIEPADPSDPTDQLVGEEREAAQRGAGGGKVPKRDLSLGSWHEMARSGLAKFAMLGLSAVLGLVITRMIITNFGTAAFAQYGLLVGLGALIPVNALGVGAPLMNSVAVSTNVSSDDHLRRVILTSLRVLLIFAGGLVAVVLLISATGSWSAILGSSLMPATGPTVAALCLILWAIGMPIGVGSRLLAGLGKNHLYILIGGLQSPLVLLFLFVAIPIGGDTGSYVAVVSYIAALLVGVICLVISIRLISPTVMKAIRQVPRRKKYPGTRILHEAGPMSIIIVGMAIAFQTDRIILSHVDPSGLAEYTLAAQMYNPIFAIISAAGFTLWPRFAAARAKNRDESPFQISVVFAGIGLVLAIGITIIAPTLTKLASDGEISLSALIMATFSLLMVVQGLQYPLGMYLTDSRSLKFRSVMVLVMCIFNFGISWQLAKAIGPAGPVIGSIISVFLFQVVINSVYIRIRTRSPSAKNVSGTP